MLNQSLQQKLLQKLSPQQIQLIKLLEVPTVELEQRIKKEIEENPVLEEGREETENEFDNEQDEAPEAENTKDDEFSLEDYISDDDDEVPNYKLSVNNHSKDDKQIDMPYVGGVSFHEHLMSQLGLRKLSDDDLILAEHIIGNIDESGYLRREVESIVNDLAFSMNIYTDEAKLLKILDLVQDFDPPGVGARSLKECLLIQIRKKLKSEGELHSLILARDILHDYFKEFSKKHYEKIMSKLNASSDDLKDAIEEILKLNPKPGNTIGGSMSSAAQHITPDFYLEELQGELVLSLNSKNVPDLRLSRSYTEMLKGFQKNKDKNRQDKDTITFVKQKLDSAKWFIEAIKQRQNTLYLTMSSILEYQKEYFKSGDETKLRPMILKDIAEKTNLDISTISRVANSKYIQTSFGIMPLKYFFSEGMQTESGDEVSTREIKKILEECIAAEEKRKPLTDEKLAKILQEKGYQIARRTVAKYREQMGILVARLRKEL